MDVNSSTRLLSFCTMIISSTVSELGARDGVPGTPVGLGCDSSVGVEAATKGPDLNAWDRAEAFRVRLVRLAENDRVGEDGMVDAEGERTRCETSRWLDSYAQINPTKGRCVTFSTRIRTLRIISVGTNGRMGRVNSSGIRFCTSRISTLRNSRSPEGPD